VLTYTWYAAADEIVGVIDEAGGSSRMLPESKVIGVVIRFSVKGGVDVVVADVEAKPADLVVSPDVRTAADVRPQPARQANPRITRSAALVQALLVLLTVISI
jgi:hypothetical protein